jgi:phosphatidylglycerophosphatase A
MIADPARCLALGFGSGLAPVMPGTFGTLAALPVYALLTRFLTPVHILWLSVPLFLIGVWGCDRAGRALGVHDHGAIVFDEIWAMLVLLALAPQTWTGVLAAFVLFRFFDMLKPWPIRWVDRHVGGGLGVMLDDALAAIPVAVVLVQWPSLALLWQQL